MNEKIIVPLDGSSVGKSALPYVEDLVSKLSPEVQAEVILLQVLSPLSGQSLYVVQGVGSDIEYTEKQMEENKKTAINYLNKTGEALRGKGVKVTAKVAIGDVSEEIVKAAEEIDANLIAMSTHGRSGISRWAFGSVADKVLRQGGSIPVVLIKAPKKS